jgi:uncharacterized membrane protein YgcG
MKDQNKLERTIIERLDEIKPVPARDPQTAARARAQFLNQAVSASEFQRHKGQRSIFRKEQFAMNTILSVFVIASLLFGGGATVNAAQNDLPNEPLYGVKILSEDVGLRFQNDPQEKVSDLMALVQTRVQEMTRLIDSGQTPPESVELRLEQHIQQALQICTTMDDPTLEQTLLQIRDQLRQRDQDMDQLRIHATQDAQPILDRTRTMLQQRLHLVEDGLVNHEAFRNAARNGFRYGQDATSTPPPTQNGNGSGNGNGTQNGQPTIQPGNNGNGNGSGPNMDPGGPNLNATSSPTCTGDCTGPNNNSGENSNSNSNANPVNNSGSGTNSGGNNNSSGGSSSSGSGSGGNDSGGKGK